jgi:hypothetical protein
MASPRVLAVTGPVDTWFDLGAKKIDAAFGAGFAKAHPELLGAYIQACAAQLRNDVLEEDVGTALTLCGSRLGDLADAVTNHE